MRITNKMITNKYIRSINTLAYDLDKLNTQVASGRKFMKSSENTAAAVKAFQIRRDYDKGLGYLDNVDHAKSSLRNAESALMHMQELINTAGAKILQGVNGTQSSSERSVIATELKNIQEQLFQSLNSNVSNSYYFGGSNTDSRPFEIVTGKLTYNGLPLDNPAVDALKNDSLYLDIGLNVTFDGSGNIDRSTVFEYTIPGVKIVGSGTTTINGVDVSNNLYDLLGTLAAEFSKSDADFSSSTVNSLLGHFNDCSSTIMKCITEVGAKTSYLDFITSRLETTNDDLEETQLSVEGADPAKTYIQFKTQQVAYQAALQMGTKIIQPSIFDFMS